MKKTITAQEVSKSGDALEQLKRTASIQIDFSGEGVGLLAEISVGGGEEEALKYAPVFERDLRENYKELFPQPEPEEPKEPIEEAGEKK